MKVYTKTGDLGQTSLIGEKRSKDNIRIEAYGSVDEALAYIGDILAINNLPIKIKKDLLIIVDKLFDLNRQLATIDSKQYIYDEDITFLEEAIDTMDLKLSSLNSFILPLGDPIFTKLNITRTIVRRAERRVVSLIQEEEVDYTLVRYLNRLSDYFFVASRYTNYCNGKKDILKQFK